MSSLQHSFDELRQRLNQGSGLNLATDDPVFYLVFRPEEMLEVKHKSRQWTAKLKLEGWNVHSFSMAIAIHEILHKNELWNLWLASEQEDPLNFEEINKTIADALTANNELRNRLLEKIESLQPENKDLLFVTDVEALHPYLRVDSLEQSLQGKFKVPTVIFYPGVRTGRTTLRFLGIYPEDGNYRSIHIGG